MTRFRPRRAGIVNLWDYGYEIFTFADGRLVLRGANGSGKTKALELLFPFVLDARLVPQRLDPFSGEGRTMKQNLLYRPEREASHGYVWLELSRPHPEDPDGPDDVRTIGIGMRAQRHRDSVTSWFFVTDTPIGDAGGFDVVDEERRPRTARQLADVLGADAVVERAADYRAMIDRELFGLGPERYDALVHLVLFLRRPQLAKDLDVTKLSDILSQGLRPLDEELLDRAARSFDDLEAHQHELERLARARQATDTFVARYRAYLRTVARERVDRVRGAERTSRAARRAATTAEATIAERATAREVADAATAALEASEREARGEREALLVSPAYQEAQQLRDLAERAAAARDEAARAEQSFAAATTASQRAAQAADAALAAADEALAERGHAAAAVRTDAAAAGIPWDDPDVDVSVDTVRDAARAAVTRREAEVRAVRRAVAEVTRATDAVAAAEDRVDAAAAGVDRARDGQTEADAAVARTRAEHLEQIDEWAAAHQPALVAPEIAAVRDATARVGVDEDGPSPSEALTAAVQARRDGLAAAATRLDDREGELAGERAEVEEERARLVDEHDLEPPPPPTRATDRATRRGAPLWRLVDFADGVDPTARAGLEAALEAAGLLDAWVDASSDPPASDPTSDVLDSRVLTGPAVDGPSLADVLVPSIPDGSPVDAPTVAALLASVPLADAAVVVGTDGRWRLGPLAGAWAKDQAAYIGATARAANRARRLAALDEHLARLDAELRRTREERDARLAEIAAIAAAVAAVPGTAALRAAIAAADRAAGRVAQAELTLVDARHDLEARRAAATTARQAAAAEARRHDLPADDAGLDAVSAAIDRVRSGGQRLVAASATLADRRRHAAVLSTQAEDRAGERDRARDAHAAARGRAEEVGARYRALHDALGDDPQRVLDRLEVLGETLTRIDTELRAARAIATDAATALARAEQAATDAAAAAETAAAALAATARCLVVLERPDHRDVLGLAPAPPRDLAGAALGEALAELEAATTGASGTDERLKAVRSQVNNGFQELERELGVGYHAAWDTDDDVIEVTVADDAGTRPIGRFATALAAAHDEQVSLLSERERQVFEDTLLASLSSQLHHRIRDARDQLDAMNESLRSRATSSGLGVALAWSQPDDAPPGQRRLAALLDRDPALLSTAERDELRTLFATEIREARAEDPGRPYRALLATVLDYRAWRRFTLRMSRDGGPTQPLTRKVFNTLSGGERATALHLPLFAAAAAHYSSARPGAPRLVALDEAFAGIDEETQAKLLGLTVEFDLDLFLTGHDLWCTHPTVPSIAIYDLLHLRDQHVVHAMPFRWDGRELVGG